VVYKQYIHQGKVSNSYIAIDMILEYLCKYFKMLNFV